MITLMSRRSIRSAQRFETIRFLAFGFSRLIRKSHSVYAAAALSQPRQPYDKRTYNASNPPKVAIMANICSHLRKPVSSQQQLVTAPSCDHFQLISKISKLKNEFCCKILVLQMLTLPSFAKRNIFQF